MGHKVTHMSKQLMNALPMTYDGYMVLGNWSGEYWNSIQPYINDSIDLISGVSDLHWVNPGLPFLKALRERKARTKHLLYFPIDGYPMGSSHYEVLKYVDYPVVFSQYACAAMDDMGYKSGSTYDYIPHGVNVEVFKPLPPDVRAKVRTDNGFGDKFVVGSTNRNNYRKMMPRLFEAFSDFSKGKSDAIMLLHCDPADSQGYNLHAWAKKLGLENKIKFTGIRPPMVGFEDPQLNAIYNAMDVFATASTGEGFGLPILEAESAGVPVIGGDHTAQTELIKDKGWLVKTMDEIPTHEGLNYYSVSRQGLTEALEEAYSNFGRRKQNSIASRRFAEGYDWKTKIAPMWESTLNRIGAIEGWKNDN